MAACVPELEALRFFSSVFSRSFFTEMMETGAAPKLFAEGLAKYDASLLKAGQTLGNCLRTIYGRLARNYRSEYVYKNALLCKLVRIHARRETVIFSEFRCGDSYADLVMLNGESRVYEIKTELDSPARLERQLANYKAFFQRCYIVTHESLAEKYSQIDPEVGVIELENGSVTPRLHVRREAPRLQSVNVDVLMQTLHTNEYKTLVRELCGKLPPVGAFQMYDACAEMLRGVDGDILQDVCVRLLKERGKNSKFLWDYSRSTSTLLQMCLALHMVPAEHERLKDIMKKEFFV
ncbi:MAG: sce7726 family protein [Akkermansia sp.]|nr:sce7726 family protein [Akkermansia sp.]